MREKEDVCLFGVREARDHLETQISFGREVNMQITE